jgi:hypothetical protein
LRAFSHDLPVTGLSSFRTTIMRNIVQQQSGFWAGQDAHDCSKGWMPSGIQGPWQDRRLLIAWCDQHPAILRMVFVFQVPVLS